MYLYCVEQFRHLLDLVYYESLAGLPLRELDRVVASCLAKIVVVHRVAAHVGNRGRRCKRRLAGLPGTGYVDDPPIAQRLDNI